MRSDLFRWHAANLDCVTNLPAAMLSATARADQPGRQESSYLPGQYLTLQLHQERLALSKGQTEVLHPTVLLVQHDDVIDASSDITTS